MPLSTHNRTPGRAELPESLKALFRPITVVVPDRQLIMENMLMAEVRCRSRTCDRGAAEPSLCCLQEGVCAGAGACWRQAFLNPKSGCLLMCCCLAFFLAPPSQGFVEAKVLAKKFAALYFLLEDLLSPAKHYDWCALRLCCALACWNTHFERFSSVRRIA